MEIVAEQILFYSIEKETNMDYRNNLLGLENEEDVNHLNVGGSFL